MGNPGFIYVLTNPSIPNCVKIGKTNNDSSSRAAQLSAASGVPTPFVVEYEAYFKDCDVAEMYVHALLELRRLRLTPNREFFAVPSTEAIAAVKQAQKKYGSANINKTRLDEYHQDYSDPLLSELTMSDTDPDDESWDDEPWAEVLDEANAYDYGTEDIIEDKSRAVEKYKLAAKLGSDEAYIRLAEIYAHEYNDKKKGLEWLKQGADRNLKKCWVELGHVFSGENFYFDREDIINIENALKCYRKFLRYDDLVLHGLEGTETFFVFKRYLELLAQNTGNYYTDEMNAFVSKFRRLIIEIGDKNEAATKLGEFNELLKKFEFTKDL